MTSKAARHIKLHANSVWEWVQDKTLKVVHVAGKTNTSNIFTKEMWDSMHFHRLCDSFMSRLSDFLSESVLAIHNAQQPSPRTVAPAVAQVSLSNGNSPFGEGLTSSSFFRTVPNILHLSSADQQILWRLHGFVLSSLI
jgi:hypothetical protein